MYGTKNPTIFGTPRSVGNSTPASAAGSIKGGIVNSRDLVASGMAAAVRDHVTCKTCGQMDHDKMSKLMY